MRLGLATNRFERGVCVRVLGVGHAPAVGPLTDAWVTERIRAIHEASGGRYGSPRVRAMLAGKVSASARSAWAG